MAEQISILQWNANGLRSRFDFKNFISETKPDVICIQETKLKPTISYNLSGYNIYRNDRDSETTGGGVAILIKSNILGTQSPKINNLESLTLTLRLNGKPFIITNIYNPPLNKIDIPTVKPLFNNDNTLIVGDFNAKSSLWYSNSSNENGNNLADLVESTELICLNSKHPTHISYHGADDVLDLGFVSPSLAIKSNHYVLSDPMGSDHYPIIIKIGELPELIAKPPPRWKMKKANWPLYSTISETLVNQENFSDNNLDNFYSNILEGITATADAAIPLNKPNNNHKTPSLP
jgi:Endonuclease-reverse transcriptase